MTGALAKALSDLKLAHPDMLGTATELVVTRSGHFEVCVNGCWYLICTVGGSMRVPIDSVFRTNGKKVRGVLQADVFVNAPAPLCANGGAVTLDCKKARDMERTLVAVLPVR